MNQGVVSDASGNQATLAKPKEPPKPAEIPTWGKRYTWDDGIAVEIAAPVECKPSEYAVASGDIQRAVKVTITVINGTDEAFKTDTLTYGSEAQFDGRKAEEIFDSNGGCGSGFDTATVLPGKTFTTEMAFAVGPTTGEMQIALRPDFGADEAVFVGQA